MIRLVSAHEGSPAVTVPPALPGCRWCQWIKGASLIGTGTGADQLVWVCRAIAQTKPASSRAIAVVTTVAGLPLLASWR